MAVLIFCVLGCNFKTELVPLINPVVEIDGLPNQKIYVTYDRLEGVVVKGAFNGSSSNNPGPRNLDKQGKLTLTFDGVTHGLDVRIVNLNSETLNAVALAENADAVKGTVSEKLEYIHLALGYQADVSDGMFYRDPESCVKEASPFLPDEQ